MVDLIHRFSVLKTSDPEELRSVALSKFGATRVDVMRPHDFEARASFAEVKGIALAFGATTSALTISFPEADFTRLQISLKGCASTSAGNQITNIDEQQACMTSAGVAADMSCGDGHERLTLRVNNSSLDRKLASMLGGKPRGTLEFAAALNMQESRAQALLRMILFLGRELDATADPCTLVLKELEQSIIVGLLTATRHSFSGFLERGTADAAPWQVRTAEEYIIANADRAILIEELTALTGVSARSLFKSFKQTREYTPMAFIKMARLRRAKAILSEGGQQTTVTGTAFLCGFSNLGHFAKDYREAFGELPSDTLGKSRGMQYAVIASRSDASLMRC